MAPPPLQAKPWGVPEEDVRVHVLGSAAVHEAVDRQGCVKLVAVVDFVQPRGLIVELKALEVQNQHVGQGTEDGELLGGLGNVKDVWVQEEASGQQRS